MDTFSVNSLKILNNSIGDFEKKYINKTEFISKTAEAKLGERFHGLICYYLKNFNIEKYENALSEEEKIIWTKVKNSSIVQAAKEAQKKYVEQPFYVKEQLSDKEFYLTGRFDAVIKNGEDYIILDWKTKNLPKNPEFDIQTMVYTFCASKLFKTKKIKMVYYSLEMGLNIEVDYREEYSDKIKEIVKKADPYRAK